MKTVRINYLGFWKGFDKKENTITNLLKEKYVVEISDKPDYIFYSTFDSEYLNYDCVKIFYTGECVVPDFDLCDYAIGFDNIIFGDRYIRVPLYELFQYRSKYLSIVNNSIDRKDKTSFCGFVVSNDQGMKEREEMFHLLCKYKKVDSGGRFLNNIGGCVKDKLAFDQSHKFSLTFENCSHPGYTTEKIVEAFAAGTIPIYFGNPQIGKEFNTKSFVNIHDYPSLEEAAKRVIEIDSSREEYNRILAEPIITGARNDLDDFKAFLYNIFDQPLSDARRRPFNTRVTEKENAQKLVRLYNEKIGNKIKRLRSIIRRIKRGAI